MSKGIWIIIRSNNKTEINYFKYNFIKCLFYVLINKIKGNEVDIIYEKDI